MDTLKLEAGMYGEALSQGKTLSTWLEDHIVEKGFAPTPYIGMGNRERMAYKKMLAAQGKEIAPDAFDIALKQFGIQAFGSVTDSVGKFFQNADSAVLFPEFVSRTIYASAIQASLVDRMGIERVVISNSFEFKKIYLEENEKDLQLSLSGRNDTAPQLKIKVGAKSVNLQKFWRSFLLDYQAIYNTPLALYSAVLRRIGEQLGVDATDDFIYTLLNGDGNSNGLSATYVVETGTSGTITKADFINFCTELPLPYAVDRYVATKAQIQKVWDMLSDMSNPPTQWAATSIPMPNGYEWDRSVLTSDYLLGIDAARTGQYVTNDGALMTETDRIINKQQVETVVSTWGIFSIIDQKGIAALDITH